MNLPTTIAPCGKKIADCSEENVVVIHEQNLIYFFCFVHNVCDHLGARALPQIAFAENRKQVTSRKSVERGQRRLRRRLYKTVFIVDGRGKNRLRIFFAQTAKRFRCREPQVAVEIE